MSSNVQSSVMKLQNREIIQNNNINPTTSHNNNTVQMPFVPVQDKIVCKTANEFQSVRFDRFWEKEPSQRVQTDFEKTLKEKASQAQKTRNLEMELRSLPLRVSRIQ